MNKYFSGAYGFTVQLNAGDRRVNLPDIPLLRDKRIKHLDICQAGYINTTPDGNSVFAGTNYFVTLREQNTQRDLISKLPAIELMPDENRGARLFINKIIDLQNSFVDIPEGSDTDNVDIYFVAYFDYTGNRGIVSDNNRTAIYPLELAFGDGKRSYFSENKDIFRKSVRNILASLPGKTPTGNTGINTLNDLYLTLSENNIEFFYRVPVYLLNQSLFNFPLRFQNVKFDPENSYVETVTDLSGQSLFMSVEIDDNKN